MLSKSLIQFSVYGRVCVPFPVVWPETMAWVMKIMVTSFKRSCAQTVVFSARDPAMGHCRPMPPHETPGLSQASLGQSLVGSIVQSNSVTQSCPTLCDPMDCSMPGLSVHHQLPEFTQTHVH